MMTMFVFFLVLYLHPADQRRQPPQPAPRVNIVQASQPDPADQADSSSNQALQVESGQESAKFFDLSQIPVEDEEFSKIARIDLPPDRTIRIILAADLLFPSGKADLNPKARENIKKTAKLLKSTPYMINVAGHTDDQPIKGGKFFSNWELSVMRATSVARLLIEETGLPPSQFTVSGHSSNAPQHSNTSEANRAKNRRVEIVVSRETPPTESIAALPDLTPEERFND